MPIRCATLTVALFRRYSPGVEDASVRRLRYVTRILQNMVDLLKLLLIWV